MTGVIAMPFFENVYEIEDYPVKTSLIMSLYTVYVKAHVQLSGIELQAD